MSDDEPSLQATKHAETLGEESTDGTEDRRNPILPMIFPSNQICYSNQGVFGTLATSLEVRSKAILGQVQPKDLAKIMDHSDLRRTGANSYGGCWLGPKIPRILG